jgi:hypothetical protein
MVKELRSAGREGAGRDASRRFNFPRLQLFSMLLFLTPDGIPFPELSLAFSAPFLHWTKKE